MDLKKKATMTQRHSRKIHVKKKDKEGSVINHTSSFMSVKNGDLLAMSANPRKINIKKNKKIDFCMRKRKKMYYCS